MLARHIPITGRVNICNVIKMCFSWGITVAIGCHILDVAAGRGCERNSGTLVNKYSICSVFLFWEHCGYMAGKQWKWDLTLVLEQMLDHVWCIHSVHIPNVPMRCNPHVMGGYVVRIFGLGPRCEGWLWVRDNIGKIGKHI